MGGTAICEMTKTRSIIRPKILSNQSTHVRLAYGQQQGFDSQITTAPPKRSPTSAHRGEPVGASLLAMVVNDDAGHLTACGALRFIASRLAPTVDRVHP
jgi:hypothetical protein